MPVYSPDGTRIAFISDRSGTLEVWISDADGTHPRQVTDLGHAIWPRWSPSGSRIVFNSMPGARSYVYVLDASGGFPRVLVEGGTPDWSADERWIYFMSPERDGPMEKMPARGGQPVRLTEDRALLPQRAPDDQVFFARDFSPDNKVWSVSAEGGESALVLDTPVDWSRWCVWNRNLVFIQANEEGPSIKMQDLTTGETTDLVGLETGTTPSFGVNVSPDGRWILYTRLDSSGADLMVVENFR